MSATVILELNVKPEALDDVLGSFREILPDTRAFDGCEEVNVYQDDDDPNHVVLVEQWESLEHQAKYLAWRTESGFVDQMMQALTGPPTFTHLNGVRV